ncbi:MAG: redoxin domain-containing protein [Bryobacteraceae bacterium]|nr:redoxin domain-containing protein [Bryobacteraceae bacterium]
MHSLKAAFLSLVPMAIAAQLASSDLDRVAFGAKPPAFELPAADGTRVSLESLAGKNVVLVFYRGYW